MMRRRKTVSRFSLEVGFEPRRDGQMALRGAYQHLLPPLSRLVRPTPALDFLPAVMGLMAAGSEDVWRMDGAFPTT